LGAAFLSNEAGILDSVRFQNSAAYLASWIQKLENDPGMIVSAASHAQRSSDFIMGIAHKESLRMPDFLNALTHGVTLTSGFLPSSRSGW
jgi:antirestriction protein ArdC